MDEYPFISRERGEIYDVTLEALSPQSGQTLAQVHLKIIVANKNQFAPKFDHDTYSTDVSGGLDGIVAALKAPVSRPYINQYCTFIYKELWSCN